MTHLLTYMFQIPIRISSYTKFLPSQLSQVTTTPNSYYSYTLSCVRGKLLTPAFKFDVSHLN